MLKLKSKLEALIEPVLLNAFPEVSNFFLSIPKQSDHGDYASNIALRMAKQYKKSPVIISEEMCLVLNNSFSDSITFTPISGFINVSLNDATIWDFLSGHNETSSFSKKNESVLLEYVSANPTGPLHIGHGRWAVIGDTLHRLMTYIGYSVDREFYINDAGNQIQLLNDSVNAVKKGLPVPEDGYQGAYIKDLAKYDSDPKLTVLDNQKKTLSSLRVEFDNWFSEKSLHDSGAVERALTVLKERGVTYDDGGALWFRSTEYGDDKDRVLIKSDGAYTYFAVDIAYHYDKLKRSFNELINIWGADHHGYIPRVRAAVSVLSDSEEETVGFSVILGQLVSLYRDGEQVRMSKRTGDMITLEEVVNEIGVDATRFFLLEKSADTHLDFDLDLAKKTSNENPVYYVQYAHARLCSIQRKLNDLNLDTSIDFDAQLDNAERLVLMHILRVKDAVEEAALTHSPYQIIQYALRLARLFHSFYESCPILKAEHPVQVKRLKILLHTQETLKLVLGLCGVSAPNAM